MSKVNIARGMRDLLPAKMIQRQQVISKIQNIFESFGFLPLETPAVERIETLMGKYGEEGGKLIFKILARGEAGTKGKCDLALRYDLTVPLARVVAMNPGLMLPFKRYQIQPVWRADRPQKGRFREFYQCDVDVVGSENYLAEAECLAIVHQSLDVLGFEHFKIKLNDRRLLTAMIQQIGAQEQETDVLISIDKLDKIGEKGVRAELKDVRGLDDSAIEQLFQMLSGEHSISGMEEIEEGLSQIRKCAILLGVAPERIVLDRKLARGLDYYTGPVFETVLTDANIGSVSGGGRYDGLIGMFSGRDVPAVGVSLGLERLLVIMEERGMFDEQAGSTHVFVTVFSSDLLDDSLAVAQKLRSAGIKVTFSLKSNKLAKQIKAAHRQNIKHVIVVGPDDVAAGVVQWKNLSTSTQRAVSIDELCSLLKN